MIKHNRRILKMAGEPISNTMLLEITRNVLKPNQDGGLKQLNATYALFDASPEDGGVDQFISGLKQVAEDWRATNQQHAKKWNTTQKKGPCSHCGGTNHDETTCYKLHPELDPRGKGKSKRREKNKSGSPGRGSGKDGRSGKEPGRKKGAGPPEGLVRLRERTRRIPATAASTAH